MASVPSKPAITLEQLVALNDEIASLVRGGVPLDRGLHDLGSDLPGRLGRYATELSMQLARGESLTAALTDSSAHLPRVYRAVIEAGIAAGRLPAALESVAAALRRLAETRRAVALTAIYPILLLAIAWSLFAFSVATLAPMVANAFHDFKLPGEQMFRHLAGLGRSAWIWGPIGPAVLAVLAAAWWIISRGATAMEGRSAAISFGWIPWLRRMRKLSDVAAFVELLKLLVENRVPMDQAVALAGEASGDAGLNKAAGAWAAAIRRGEKDIPAGGPALPPLLRWLIAGGQRNDALLPALRHAADDYQRRAQDQAELIRVLLPVVFTCCVGGLIVASYTIVLLGPYFYMLRSLARIP